MYAWSALQAGDRGEHSFAAPAQSGYSLRVHRRTHRRLIVMLALLCQVLTGTVVHIPAAVAAPTTTGEAPPCHAHALEGDTSVAGVRDHIPVPDPASPSHHCKSGFCTCVCAHAVAMLPATEAARPPVPAHPPLPWSAPAPDAPLWISVFFRPPI